MSSVMPAELLEYFEKGGLLSANSAVTKYSSNSAGMSYKSIVIMLRNLFALCISSKVLHSVRLDESHEMLINKEVKQAIVSPT